MGINHPAAHILPLFGNLFTAYTHRLMQKPRLSPTDAAACIRTTVVGGGGGGEGCDGGPGSGCGVSATAASASKQPPNKSSPPHISVVALTSPHAEIRRLGSALNRCRNAANVASFLRAILRETGAATNNRAAGESHWYDDDADEPHWNAVVSIGQIDNFEQKYKLETNKN